MDCLETRRIMDEMLDGYAAPDVEAHLAECDDCGAHWARLGAVDGLLRSASLFDPPSPNFSAAVVARLGNEPDPLPAGMPMLARTLMSADTMMSADTLMSAGTSVPADTAMPAGTSVPADTAVPASTSMAGGAPMPATKLVLASTPMPAGTRKSQTGPNHAAVRSNGLWLIAALAVGLALVVALIILAQNWWLPVGAAIWQLAAGDWSRSLVAAGRATIVALNASVLAYVLYGAMAVALASMWFGALVLPRHLNGPAGPSPWQSAL